MLKEGDKVEILDVKEIEFAEMFFKNGDIIELVMTDKGLALKTDKIEGDIGLLLFKNEYKYLKKV